MTLYKKVAIELIAQERERQIEEEGYTASHDDKQGPDYYEQLVCAGETYERAPENRGNLEIWPWDQSDFKPSTDGTKEGRIKELIKAGALYLAAREHIERNGSLPPGKRMLPYLDAWIDRVANKIVELMPDHQEAETII